MDLSSTAENINNMFTQSRVAASLSSKSLSDSDVRNTGYRDSIYDIEDEEQLMSNAPAVPNIHVFWLPFIGRAQFVRDLAGYIQWSIILFYWVYGNYSTWFVILLPHYTEGRMSVVMLMIYASVSLLCLTSFIRASTSNPGTLNSHQPPEDDWTICGKCCRRRPPLAHHCRRCGQCVRKMDHHCPWINNCVGEDNQYAFMQLVAYAYVLSLTTLVLDIVHMYYLPQCLSCDQASFASRYERVIIWVAIVMAILMTCGAAGLYMSQHISILFETPSIEWMRIQHVIFTSGPSAVKWPVQTKSACTVYRTTCGEGPWFLWPFPCRRRRPVAVSHYV